MGIDNVYLGIDLGTTNSAAAIFDGEKTEMVRTAQGGLLTPSVVRIDARGNVTVGDRARRFLESDPANTRAEFKRLMGTQTPISFAASRVQRTPVELSAEVLRSLVRDVNDQFGFTPEKAVISVPALFELPQASATSDAAQQAGLAVVELIQEPIASALAAGWTQFETAGYWLVYDLGGGTFDASLLETRDGFLRVVGHDGDNFLGGRDFDNAIVDWALTVFHEMHGRALQRENPEDAPALRKIKQAAEEAKIALSRTQTSVISIPDVVDGLMLELEIDRASFRALVQPLVDRSVAVCQRLLRTQRVERDALRRIVLVGGPTLTPFLRERVRECLGAPLGEGLDPMTLVAQGAALFAASVGLEARPRPSAKVDGRALWLQYPPVSTDLSPHVVGRLVGAQGDPPLHAVSLSRTDGRWTSGPIVLDKEGAFVAQVALQPRTACEFTLKGSDRRGLPIDVQPSRISIVQGLTIGDPPLSRSVGVALASNRVRTYLERGVPLPARCTFVHHTVSSVVQGARDFVLRIPIVQGEFERADLCRLVGTLEIAGTDLPSSMPAGTALEVTVEVDRSGRLSARARVESLGLMFERVAHLRVPDADPQTLGVALQETFQRFAAARPQLLGPKGAVEKLEIEMLLGRVQSDIDAARGGDADSAQKARRSLQEIDARLEVLESRQGRRELNAELRDMAVSASGWVSKHGTPAEQSMLDELVEDGRRADADGDVFTLQQCVSQIRRLRWNAFLRDPSAWPLLFESACSRLHKATDLPRAHRLADEGQKAEERGDMRDLQRITEALLDLVSDDPSDRQKGYDSGVR